MKNNVVIVGLLFMTTCILFLSACDKKDKPTDLTEEDSMSEPTKTNEHSEEVQLPTSPLQKWDEGKDVKDLQHLLTELTYELDPSGTFDERTTWAITDIQLQTDGLSATGLYDEETKQAIQTAINGDASFTPEEGLALPSDAYLKEGSSSIVENPYDILALINKEHALPSDYIPNDLVFPDIRFPFTEELPKRQLREIAANALEELFAASDEEGLDLFAQSGYRSYDTQDTIFASNVERHGEEAANNFSARPGESEHQSGLTMDVSTPSVDYMLVVEFGETPEGIWLAEHAHEYGFIIRYEKGKEHITQYQYEPWHLRYVGPKVASEVVEQGVTYEEYIEQK